MVPLVHAIIDLLFIKIRKYYTEEGIKQQYIDYFKTMQLFLLLPRRLYVVIASANPLTEENHQSDWLVYESLKGNCFALKAIKSNVFITNS